MRKMISFAKAFVDNYHFIYECLYYFIEVFFVLLLERLMCSTWKIYLHNAMPSYTSRKYLINRINCIRMSLQINCDIKILNIYVIQNCVLLFSMFRV